MGKRVRQYRVYTPGPGQPITNSVKNYHHGLWIVHVRAKSIKQAYLLVSRGQVVTGRIL